MTVRLRVVCLVLLAVLSLRAADKAKPVVSILGDSYSTFENYVPEGNASWYAPVPWEGRTDVTDVRQTWWWQLIDEGGYKLGVNDSYSGATISYTGYDGADYSDRSFLTRYSARPTTAGPAARSGSMFTAGSPAGICMSSVRLWQGYSPRLATVIPALA